MKIERFEIPGLAQYSYIVSSEGHAAVIDPIRDIDRYTTYAAEHHLTISHILETHIHADFAAGSTALAKATGAELALSAHDEDQHYRYTMPHRDLHDGESLKIGAIQLRTLHTPGHTPEHLSFLLFDLKRSAADPVALFSGDFLFVGGLGRPDLLGEAAKQQLANELFRSLHERIASLPDSLEVYPGHGAGSLCGSGISEQSESTLGYERATNPLFQLDETTFIRQILASVPPMPTYYPRMKKANAEGAPLLTELPGGHAISIEEMKQLISTDVTVLDLRRPEAFGGAHIPGAINIGEGQNLSLWAGWLLDPAKPIILVSDGNNNETSRRALIRVGLDNIAGSLDHGMAAWIDAGLPIARITQLSTSEVNHHPPDAEVIDVRSDQEWHTGHIAGARHIMLGDLSARMSELPKSRPLILVCGSGYRSSIASSLLAQNGFTETNSMLGGMSAWNHRGLPLAISS